MTVTGRMVWEQAMHLLGYTSDDGALSGRDELLPRALAVVNQIYTDLWYTPGGCLPDAGIPPGSEETEPTRLSSLDEPVPLSTRALTDVMPWGVAMLMAQSESDGDSQALMSMTYNAKRAVLSRMGKREDVLPWPV